MKSLNQIKKPEEKGKVLEFLQDADYYFDRALEYLDSEEFLPALDDIRQAIKLEPDELDFKFLLAQIYSDMGLFQKSNFEYFKLLATDENLGECYLRISQNYFMLKDETSAVNYLKKSIEFDFDEDEIIDVDELMQELNRGDFKLLSQNSEDEMLLSCVNKLISISEYDGALQLLQYIKSNSKHYINALNSAAFCNSCIDNPQQEIELSQKVLEYEPDNIGALCNISDGYVKIGDIEKAKEAAQKIINLNISDINEYFKVSIILLQCDFHEQAIKMLNSYLSYYPYNESALMLLSLAYYNQGEIELAKDYMYKLVRIDNSNTIAKYYNQLFQDNSQKPTKLPYIRQVPEEEVQRRISMFEKISTYTSIEMLKLIQADPDFFDYLKWLFNFGETKLSEKIIIKLAHVKFVDAQEFLRNCLVDPSLPYIIKQMILKKLVSVLPKHKIALLHEDQIKFISPKVTKQIFEFPRVYFEAYLDVFCSLAFVDNDYERAFNRTVKKILNLIVETKASFHSRRNIGALFAYSFKRPEMFQDLDTVIKIFGADKKSLKIYLNKLGIDV
ncbi:MAG TPA: tetratricopeptide repeat protein [Clostridia bacterium]